MMVTTGASKARQFSNMGSGMLKQSSPARNRIDLSTKELVDPILAGLVKSTGKVEPTKTFSWLSEMVMDTKSRN
jgi:hypothetical protein